jgi:hypothetical protein
MHSARHYRQRAAQVLRLTESVLDPVLLEQLKIVASDYDQIADDMDKLPTTSRPNDPPALPREPFPNRRQPASYRSATKASS